MELPQHGVTPGSFSLSQVSYLVAACLLHHMFLIDWWQHALKNIASWRGKESNFMTCSWDDDVLPSLICSLRLLPLALD